MKSLSQPQIQPRLVVLVCSVVAMHLVMMSMAAQSPAPPRYAVGSIPDQRVWFNPGTDGLTFDVFAEGLGDTPTITASYDQGNAPDGELSFDTDLDRFRFSPAPTDVAPIDITFLAVGSGTPVLQTVRIEPIQPLPPEQAAFGIQPTPSSLPDPEDRDYIVIEDESNEDSIAFNENTDVETRSVKIIGKRVVFEAGHPNGLFEDYHGRADLKNLEIQADTLVIRGSLHFPQTTVIIRAIDVVFEDRPGEAPAALSTEPLRPFGGSAPARNAGSNQTKPEGGHTGGAITVWLNNLVAPEGHVRFIARGGRGRDARPGQDGTDLATRDALERTIQGVNTGTDYLLFLWIVKPWPAADEYHPSRAGYEASVDWDGNSLLRDPSGNYLPNAGQPGSKPGDGGGGGDVTSNLNLEQILDQEGGTSGGLATVGKGGRGVRVRPHGGGALASYGIRAKVTVNVSGNITGQSEKQFNTREGADAPPPAADVPVGTTGAFTLQPESMDWLSPAALRVSLNYLNDAYLEGHLTVVSKELERLINLIEAARQTPGWTTLAANDQEDIGEILDDLWTLQHRIGSNLDYFGNPAGWVPMLSFEVNKLAFDNEIDRAMRVMYLNYWLGNRATTIAQKLDALRAMRDELLGQIETDRKAFDEAVQSIPSVETDAANLQVEIDQVILRIQEIEDELLPRAKNIVILKKTARTMGKIAQTIPVYQPALGAAGGAVAAAADIDPDKSWEENAILVGEGTAGGFAAGSALPKAQAARSAANSVDTGDPEGNAAAAAALRQARAPLLDLLEGTYNTATASKASDPEVAAELERLLADVPEFRVLQKELDQLNVKKREFIVQLSSLIQQITVLPISISRNLRTIDLLNVEISQANRRLNPATLAYLHDMDRRARARLLKYHYYVARAYTYRRLEPYPGRLNLTPIFDEFAALASDPANDTPALDAAEFDSLKAVYEEQISSVANAILDDANQDPPEQSIVALFDLSPAVIDTLNAGGQARINLIDLNLFPTSEENLRITDLFVKAMDVEYDPAHPQPSSVDLVFQHSGVSQLQKDGQTFQFRHDNQNTRSLIQWKTRYQFVNHTLTPSRPSAASQSLIAALVPAAANVLKYSRPAVRADLLLSLDFSAEPDAVVQLNQATVEVHYDFTQRNQFLRTLRLLGAHNGLDVQINIENADRNGRATGHGAFERTYDVNSTVTLTAPESVGDLRFVRWEGGALANPTARTQVVTLSGNLTLRPVYEPATTYTLTVPGGTGGGIFFPGDIVTIQADAPGSFETFLGWRGGSVTDPVSLKTTAYVFGDDTVIPRYVNLGAALALVPLDPNSFLMSFELPTATSETWILEESVDALNWREAATLDVVDGLGMATITSEGGPRFFRAVKSSGL
jgi:hypothetical protein